MVRLSGLHVTHKSIARDWLQIDDKTLLKYYQAELDNGQDIISGELKTIVLAAARKGSLRACSYLLDRSGAWPAENVAAPQRVEVIVRGGVRSVEGEPPLPHDPDAPTG